MTAPANDLLLRALAREPVERTPVWLMRQAGRYLPEYRATREKAGNFLTLCKTPELACEVALQPLERYPLDAAILFSDILTIPDAMGLGLSLEEGEGPKFARPLRSPADVDRLGKPDAESDTGYVMDAVRTIADALGGRVPLIGFAGSPWTLAAYMIEGRSSTDFKLAKAFMLDEPDSMRKLLHLLSDSIIEYLNAQVHAGANALMIFDSWGGMLSPHDYRSCSLEPIARIVRGLDRQHEGRRVPVVVFSKGANASLEDIADCGCDAMGLDWTIELAEARKRVGDRVALQGNLDPAVLYARPDRIRAQVRRTLESYGQGAGHVFNLGHGLQPAMNPEHVGVCVDAVREFSSKLRA